MAAPEGSAAAVVLQNHVSTGFVGEDGDFLPASGLDGGALAASSRLDMEGKEHLLRSSIGGDGGGLGERV